jgi:hypothetical protein
MRETNIINSITEFPVEKCFFPIITIYNRPTDFPDMYVARLFDLQTPTEFAVVNVSLDTLRNSIHSANRWILIPRDINDDPNIVEVWV